MIFVIQHQHIYRQLRSRTFYISNIKVIEGQGHEKFSIKYHGFDRHQNHTNRLINGGLFELLRKFAIIGKLRMRNIQLSGKLEICHSLFSLDFNYPIALKITEYREVAYRNKKTSSKFLITSGFFVSFRATLLPV